MRNRGTGAWTFYISRRLNGANGELAGLVLVGLSTQFFSEFYQLIHLESDASISLYRRDFTLLARYPHAEEVIGKVNRTGSSYQVIEVEKKTADVIVTTSPRFVEGGRSIYRMGAPRLVEKYPLIVNVTITGELFLEGWRRSATLIAGITLVSVVALIVCFILLVRLLRRRESDLELTLLLKRQAEAANLAKTESMQELEAFSYSVSHDLRAPLRAISGYADLVAANLAGQLAGENAHYLTRLKASARRMNQLIDDFLLLSRAARSEPRRKQVDLSQLAREVIDALVQQHPEHKVEVTIASGMTAHGDPNLLRIVLENLLGNAWKYTNSAEAPRIEFGSEAGAGETVFFVRDNGVGFDMRYADKLFVPFQRLHTASEFEGSGIGLATVQRIVRRHGGRVWAKAEVNRGATFYFALPVS